VAVKASRSSSNAPDRFAFQSIETRRIDPAGFLFVRPAWAHSCGCKSRRKLITANEVKRNCVRATERGEEAWIVICEPMDKNRIEGAAEQGERASDREALVIKVKWRKSGGCAEKECVLTWGDLASRLKGRRMKPERERQAVRSRAVDATHLFAAAESQQRP
jgi:hypothetical protein